MVNRNDNVQLLQCSVDESDESEFRFLVNRKHVKYVTIDPGLYTARDMCFAPALIPLFPAFPPGDWNEGHISAHPENGKPQFERLAQKQFAGVKRTWHATFIDHLDLALGKKLRSNVYEATSQHFATTIIAKFARFDWEVCYLEAETAAYEWIDGQSIGPQFLGHLTEEGRVIGFLLERIPGGKHAGIEDLAACKEILSKVHRLGIKHGDINKHNFLVHQGKATLLDFDCAEKCEDQEALRTELESLSEQLKESTGRGGCLVETDGEWRPAELD